MDKKNVLSINKDASLCTDPKASDQKNTKVFVLPPELLKGLLLENKLPKLSRISKNESSTIVDHTKNAQSFAKNISNEEKVQKLTDNIGGIKKTVVSTKQVVKKLNAKSQLQNGTLDKSTENEKKLYLKNEEANKFNDESQIKILNKNTRRGRKKLDRDKELNKFEPIDKITNDFSNEMELKVLKDNKNTPIRRVYKRKPRIIEDKIIKNSIMSNIHTGCDNICNKEIIKSSNGPEYTTDRCLTEKDQENTVCNGNKDAISKSKELMNPVEFLSNKESLNNANIDGQNKDMEILNNATDSDAINITNNEVDPNLQIKSFDTKEEPPCEEHETKSVILPLEQNKKINNENIMEDEVGEITDEVIIIEETIEEIIEYYDSDTELNASTQIKGSLNNSKNAEWINDNSVNHTITELDSNKNESDTNCSLVTKESFKNIKPINDESKIKNELKKDEISNDVNEVSKTEQIEVHKQCELLSSENTCKIIPTINSNDSNKMETRLIDDSVAVDEKNISSFISTSGNVSKVESLNIEEQCFSDTVQIVSHKKKEIPTSTREPLITKTEIESTENLEVATNMNENNDSIRRSSRLSKNRYKPVVSNCKRKQKNCEIKENKSMIDDSLNIENNETVDKSIISQVKTIKDPVIDEKSEINITSDNIESKNVEEEKLDKILISTKILTVNDSNKNISDKAVANKKFLIKPRPNIKIISEKGNKSYVSYNDAVSMHTNEVKEYEVFDIAVNSDTLSDESHNDTVIQEISDHSLMEISGKSKKIKEILNNITDKSLKSEVSNENAENNLKGNVTSFAEEEILDNSDGSSSVNEKIPKMVSEFEKQEISKNANALTNENTNISKTVEDMENIDSKSVFSDTFDHETYGAAEFQSDSDDIEDNPIVDIPVNNNDADNTCFEKKIEILSVDVSINNDTVSDEIHNDSVTEELNDHSLMESSRKNKIEEILNNIKDSNLKPDINNTNVENLLCTELLKTIDTETCSFEENIFYCSNEKDCTVNNEVSKLVSKDKNREITNLKTELTNESLASVPETLKDIETVNRKSDFLNTYNQETYGMVESQSVTDQIKHNPDVDSLVNNGELTNVNNDNAINALTDEVRENRIDDAPIKDAPLTETHDNTVTNNVNIQEVLNGTPANKIKSNLSHTNIDIIQNDSVSCVVEEKIYEKGDEICTINKEIPRLVLEFEKLNHETSDILESQKSINEDKENAALDNPVFNNELTEVHCSGTKDQESNDQNLIETSFKIIITDDISTDIAADNNQISELTDSNALETLKMEIHESSSKKRTRTADLSINTTNSEVNSAQRRSRRLSALRSTTEAKTKDNKRNRKSNKEIQLSKDIGHTKLEDVSDSKEVPTRKRYTRSKSKTSESKVVEEKLDEKINLENKHLNEEGGIDADAHQKNETSPVPKKKGRRERAPKAAKKLESNSKKLNESDVSNVNLLKMENSNEDNSDKQQNTETVDSVEDKLEEQIPNSNVLQKKRKGRPPKSTTLKATATPAANTDSISKSANRRSTRSSDLQAVVEDSINLGKRKRRSRFDIASEINKQDDLELETPKHVLTSSRKRKRRSRFGKSTESNSQDEDFELETTKNESDHEKAITGESDNNDEKSYGRPRRKRRKRGRPSGRSVRKYDNDYEPHHSQVQRLPAKETNKTKSKTSGEPQKKENIVCGRCSKSLKRNQWINHNMSVHNNLGWIEGTVKPDYDNDEKLVVRILARLLKKRKSLICEKCNAGQRSVPGHLSHVLFCGKSDDEIKALMITCPGCKAVIKPSSLEYHERLHQRQAEEKPKITFEIIEESTDSGMKIKRKAAEKAVSKISEIVTLTKTDQDDGSGPLDKKIKLNDLKKFIQKPKLTKRISSLLLNKWQKRVNAGEDAACCQAGCTLTFKTIDEIREHYLNCNFIPQENFVCRICKYQSKSKNEIIQHAVESHTIENEDEKAYASDSDYSSESDYEDTVIKISVDRSQRTTKRLSFAERNDPLNKKYKFLFKDGVSYTMYNKTFLTGFRWTLEFEEKNYSFNLFDDYTPNTFELLKPEVSKQYLPELMESMPMTSCKKEKNVEWKTWKIFEGQCFDDFPTFFTGGPVWALAWLPIPSFLSFTGDTTQFVAISSHPTMDKEYSIGEVYSGKNIIQIWNMGVLNHNANNMSDPKLAYAIAHDGGTVWCLEWCPSGCYDHEDLLGFVKKENELRRMGLLAAACSDGCIRVYSLIFPEGLPALSSNNGEETDECLVYKTDPVLMLVVNRKLFDNEEQNWQVTKLSWTKERGHNIIVAGFSNGYVALWDLTTNSPMLKCKRDNTIFLTPFKHFLAHLHAVTMVYLVPQDNKRYLVTTSLDRHYKFWDLEDITNPRTDIKKTYVTDASWFNHWNCVLLAGDDALSMKHNYTYSRPVRELMYRYYNVFPSNSTTFTVDTSDFGNSVANGTLAGEVLALFPQQMMYINDMKQSIPRKRYFSIASSVEVVDFHESKRKESAKADSNQEEYKYMPSTYKDSKDRFGLKFCDKLNQFRTGYAKVTGINPKKTLTCEMMQSVPAEQYPFMSVNRVSWNPNSWSFLWLAVGYQNGFVRFIPFKSMASTNEWNGMLSDHIKRLKTKRNKADVNR